MDLLDRLRPKWRHPDPEVRLAAVRELGADDQSRLATVAREDADARVRRVAIKRLDDADVLAAVAEHDADPAIRELAAERTRELLVARACVDGPAAACEAALARLQDERSLVAVASTAAVDTVRHAALARVAGDRALREVVRHAADPAVRRDALARIDDASALRAVALGDTPPDLALQAVDRITDPAILHAIAEHRNAAKAVRQRARARLPETPVERAPLDPKDVRERQLALCATVEALRTTADVARAAERVDAAEREWRDLAVSVPPRDDVAQRFDAACSTILANAASLARRWAEVEHSKEALAENLAAREALCVRVDAIDGADARREIADARGAWDRLAPVSGERANALARRFTRAVEDAHARHRAWRAEHGLRVQLERLAGDAEALASRDALPKARDWHALDERWTALLPADADSHADLNDARARFAAARTALEQRWHADAERRTAEQHENVARLGALAARLEALAAADALKPGTARRELEAAEAAMQDLGPLPPNERRADWTERIGAARDALLKHYRQAEDAEDWRRWANVAAQEEIIERIEALLEAGDFAEGTRVLSHLQDDWAKVASASADKSQGLWERFRTARNELRRRCDAYMAENLEKKRALCAQVAELGDATSWNETADLIKRLQAEWKAVGPAPAKHAQALWQQFREPCDRFFARRKEHFDRLDGERRETTGRKQALCEQAEALADSTDWEATTAAMKRLQAEWKASGGPMARAQADALWTRFKGACDRFFDRRSRREEIAREEIIAKGSALCDGLDAHAASLDDDSPPASDVLGAAIDQAWAEWLRLELPDLPAAQPLVARLEVAIRRIVSVHPDCLRGTRLDPETTRKRREKLCSRMDELAGTKREEPRALSLQEMAMALRDRLATNTIAGKAGSDAKKDVARELERLDSGWAHLGPILDADAQALADRFGQARAKLRPA